MHVIDFTINQTDIDNNKELTFCGFTPELLYQELTNDF